MKYTYFLHVAAVVCISFCAGASAQMTSLKQVLVPLPDLARAEKNDQMTFIVRQIEWAEQADKRLREQLAVYENVLEKISVDLGQVKTTLKNLSGERALFVNKQLAFISRTYQVISEIIQVLRQTLAMLDEYAVELKNYQSDPAFSALLLPHKASYSFEDFKKSSQLLFAAKSGLDELEASKRVLEQDHEKRKRAFDVIAKEYDERKQQHQEFSQGGGSVEEALERFTRNQQGELLDELLRQADYRKQFAQLKVDEEKMRIELLDTRLLIKRRLVDALQAEYATLKRSLAIDSARLKAAEDALEKKRQEFFDKREKLNEHIRLLLPLKDQYKKNFDRAARRFDVSANDIAAIKEWRREADSLKTTSAWLATAVLGAIDAHEELIDTEIESLEMGTRQADIEFRHEELEVAILRSWYRMTHQGAHFTSEEDIEQEIKRYEKERAQIKADLSEISARRDSVINLLYRLNVTHDKIKILVTALAKQHSVTFSGREKEYLETQDGFVRADEEVRKLINYMGHLMEGYAKSIARLRDDSRDIDDILNELGAKGFWLRSDQSIEWRDLKNIVPDLKRFLRDFRYTGFSWLKHLSLSCCIDKVCSLGDTPYAILLLFVRLLIVVILYLIVRLYLPDLRSYLVQRESRYRFFARINTFLVILLDFIQVHLLGITLWFLLFIAVTTDMVDSYTAIWIYLLSIPYLLYLSYGFFQQFLATNRARGYIFISQNYVWRFTAVVATLICATVSISFFRQAFMVGNYYGSKMPDILLATNFIVLQIALICLIGKEQILSLFSLFTVRGTPAAQWIEERVEKYYYVVLLLVIAVIVMSNPYVGYGRQVLYVVSRVILTGCLVPLFSWLHNRLKRASSDFFFYYADGSAVKERFPGGKTWYGCFIVVGFAFFVVVGIILGARLWDIAITPGDLRHWLSLPLYSPGLDEVTGKAIEVTGMSLFKICMYVLGGFGFAYVINRYVLQRIFDPLLVGSGIQNTIMTITRYVAVVVALLLGLNSAGLEGMAMKLVVLVGILSFAVKEPLADFFAYFIILVQRPVKIGDMIQIEHDVSGIVRHITPRSTIVRSRNSVTLVIPNSVIITRTVRNWSYMRTFSAINDIELTLPFEVDVDKVRQILFDVMETHHAILKNPVPIVWLVDFVDHGYRFLVRGFLSVDKVIERFEIESQLRLEMVRRLRQEGIQLAVPVRVVKQVKDDQLMDQMGR